MTILPLFSYKRTAALWGAVVKPTRSTLNHFHRLSFPNLYRNMKVLVILYRGGEAASRELRLLQWLESEGHEFIEGPDSDFQQHIVDAEVLITAPFHPGYLTRDLTDKVECEGPLDLNAAVERKIQVLEVSGSNVVSVAMSIFLLVRNFVPAHEMIERGDWHVSGIARNAFDLEGKVVTCRHHCSSTVTGGQGRQCQRVEDPEELVSQCDVVTVNCPLREDTRGLVNAELLKHFEKRANLVNMACGAICDKDAVTEALKSGQLSGYAGDLWNVQSAPTNGCSSSAVISFWTPHAPTYLTRYRKITHCVVGPQQS
ncbi:hypothetical protein CERSUDRAFT_94994 [Gelatoporia subvermispora B]|uniref:D-isomer specific 2-hydroxyacid dehydrogenase NAD-binding domain-containing protein n=1 Tax=Ceriporiopsis subvermispora (strain B) TaxID=914234 RepID=M2RD28_CERS8|nr:hypothetical protein CERSUDRAFT_94994 [Gelatoporia subvermispora B]